MAIVSTNSIVLNALAWKAKNAKLVVRNGIGDCFSDGEYDCKKALKSGDVSYLRDALKSLGYVTTYDWADAKDKAGKNRCIALVKKAISNPNNANITAAYKECQKERKRADGVSLEAFHKLVKE